MLQQMNAWLPLAPNFLRSTGEGKDFRARLRAPATHLSSV